MDSSVGFGYDYVGHYLKYFKKYPSSALNMQEIKVLRRHHGIKFFVTYNSKNISALENKKY
eukprot:snap_masked-scaffold_15-processed-gene-5.28-mRNA-1 protein AED:1.00 eAED:1.00 QI:0/0/0/0/1/1/3/0/60